MEKERINVTYRWMEGITVDSCRFGGIGAGEEEATMPGIRAEEDRCLDGIDSWWEMSVTEEERERGEGGGRWEKGERRDRRRCRVEKETLPDRIARLLAARTCAVQRLLPIGPSCSAVATPVDGEYDCV